MSDQRRGQPAQAPVTSDGEGLLCSGEDRAASAEPITIDDLFSSYIGEFGRQQIWLFSVVALAWMPGAFVVLDMSFFGKDPIKGHLWQCTYPSDVQCSAAFKEDDPTDQFCSLQTSQWEWTHPHESVRSDLGFFCDKAWILQVSNSIFFLGFLAGSALAGVAADKYGRKLTLMASIVLGAVATCLTAATFSAIPFAAARFLQGLTVGGIGVVAFTLDCEVVGAAWRGVLGIFSQCFWCAGACLLPLLVVAVPNWRMQTLACAGTLVAMIPMFPFIPESPRWLLSQMRVSESTATLQAIADGNGKDMPANMLALPRATSGPPVTLVDTFKVPELRKRMLILMTCWFIVSLAYYGVSLALEDLPGSLYLNFFLIAVVELPSYFCTIALINRLGRRLLSVLMFICCGTACILCAIIPNGEPGSTSATLRIIAAVIGKFGVAAAFALLFVFTTELFPTVVRSAALGANSAAARVGGIASPMVVLLAEVMHAGWFSFVVFGVTTILAGCVMLGLPETVGKPLPDTIADVVGGHHHDEHTDTVTADEALRMDGEDSEVTHALIEDQ